MFIMKNKIAIQVNYVSKRKRNHSKRRTIFKSNIGKSLLNLVTCVLVCQRGLSANVLPYQRGLLANVPKACQIFIFTFQRASVQYGVPMF